MLCSCSSASSPSDGDRVRWGTVAAAGEDALRQNSEHANADDGAKALCGVSPKPETHLRCARGCCLATVGRSNACWSCGASSYDDEGWSFLLAAARTR